MPVAHRKLAITAALLLAANAALLATLRLLYHSNNANADTLVLLLMAVVAAQVNLLAIWAACARTPWPLRLPLAAAAVASLGLFLCTLEPGALTVSFMVTSIVGATALQALCVSGPLAVARVFGTRLQRAADHPPPAATPRRRLQFSVSYLLLAVTVAALALVAARELARLKPEVRSREPAILAGSPPRQTPPPLLLRRVLATWSVCAALFGLAAAKATLAARRTWWAVPPAALLALAVCPLFAWLNTDSTYAWRFALAGTLHALLVLGTLLALRRLGYRVAPPGRPRHVLCPWLALLLFTAVVAGAWRAAHAQPWLANQAIVFEDDLGGLAFSPDGALIAIERDHRTIELRDAHTLQLGTVLEGDTLLSLVAFSPDATSLICCEDPYRGPYKSWNLAAKRWEPLAKTEFCFDPAVTSDGRVLVAEDAPPAVVVRDLTTGRVVSRIALPDRVEDGVSFFLNADHATFSPDGATMALAIELIALSSNDVRQELWLVPVADASALIVLAERLNFIDQTFSSSDQLVTLDVPEWSGQAVCHVRFWDSRTGRELRSFPVPGGWGTPVVSPDGKMLALSGGRLNPLLSALLAAEHGSRGEMDYVALWDIATGRPLRGFITPSYTNNLAFSPDGNTLAAVSGNAVYLWNVSD